MHNNNQVQDINVLNLNYSLFYVLLTIIFYLKKNTMNKNR